MSKNKPVLSIIIVHYHADEAFFDCVQSILKSNPKITYELIVVDNDEVKTIQKKLEKIVPNVVYVPSPRNVGYGGAVNQGAAVAKGIYLCLMNPDIILLESPIDTLYKYSSKEKKAGIVAAVMLDKDRNLDERQGGAELTPKNAIFSHSIINKYFPNNPVVRSYWTKYSEINHIKPTYSVPFGLLIVKRAIFEKVDGFDEEFFLYFEDYDLGKRIQDAGYINYICADAKIIHLSGKGGTENVSNLSQFSRESRHRYFKKHYGILNASIVDVVLNFGKWHLLLFAILLLSLFLRFSYLPETMMFIGDQGWFYLSARDMLLLGEIPLVGIASSHPWLHQGAFWTYILAPIFALTQFHPLAPGYFVAGLGVVTTYMMYFVGKRMFSKRIGFLAAALYASSPLIAFYDRMPYHTSPIALLTLLLVYSIFKWIRGNSYGFPISIALLAILYNFQISTTPLLASFIVITAYGFWKKKKYFMQLLTKKIALLSFFAWFVPMMPMLLYDISHGFPQTVKFVLWVGYKIALLFGFPSIHGDTVFAEVAPFWPFTINEFQRLLFLPNTAIAIGLLILSLGYLIYHIYVATKKKLYLQSHTLLLTLLVIPLLSYFVIKTPSSAYFPMFFPTIMLTIAITFDSLISRKHLKSVGYVALLLFIGYNSYAFVQSNFLMGPTGYGPTFRERLDKAEAIVNRTDGIRYNIEGKGPGSQFESFTMNTEFLTWWLGNGPSDKPEKVKIPVTEY